MARINQRILVFFAMKSWKLLMIVKLYVWREIVELQITRIRVV